MRTNFTRRRRKYSNVSGLWSNRRDLPVLILFSSEIRFILRTVLSDRCFSTSEIERIEAETGAIEGAIIPVKSRHRMLRAFRAHASAGYQELIWKEWKSGF